MNKGWILPILVSVFLAALFGGVFYGIVSTFNNRGNAIGNSIVELQDAGFQIVEGELHSPTVIEITHDYAVFTSFCNSNGITKIFNVNSINSNFVAVVNETYGMKYVVDYHSQFWWVW